MTVVIRKGFRRHKVELFSQDYVAAPAPIAMLLGAYRSLQGARAAAEWVVLWRKAEQAQERAQVAA